VGLAITSYLSIVNDENEAKKLIEIAELNIRGASEVLEPVQAMHGKIAFWRKINFDGWIKNQQRQLIQELKKSGHNPPYEEKERLERMLTSGIN